jgi:type II secretory pathway component PulL
LARKSNHIHVLQFDAHTLSCLTAEPEGKALTVRAHVVERGDWSADPQAPGAALKGFVERLGLAEDRVYTLVPRHEVTARVIALPSQDPAEIDSMVRLSAEEYVPYPAADLVIAHSILQKLPGGESRVLIALAHRDVLHAHLQLLETAGVVPEQVYLGTTCLATALAASGLAGEEPVGLVSLGSSGLEALVFSGGRLAFTRGVASAQDWSASGEAAVAAEEELALEVRGSLAAYRRESEDGIGVDRVLLACDWTHPAARVESLAAETGKECQAAPLPASLVASGADQLQGVPWAALGAALTAFGHGRNVIELLPHSVVEGRRLQGAQAQALRIAAVAALLLASLGALYGQAVYQRSALVRELEAQRARLEPNARGIAEKQEQLYALRRKVEQSGTALEYLGALAQLAPEEGLNLSRVNYARESGLEIFGRAVAIDDIHAYAERMRGMKDTFALFAQARSLYEERAMERNQPVFLYQIALMERDDDEVGRTTGPEGR